MSTPRLRGEFARRRRADAPSGGRLEMRAARSGRPGGASKRGRDGECKSDSRPGVEGMSVARSHRAGAASSAGVSRRRSPGGGGAAFDDDDGGGRVGSSRRRPPPPPRTHPAPPPPPRCDARRAPDDRRDPNWAETTRLGTSARPWPVPPRERWEIARRADTMADAAITYAVAAGGSRRFPGAKDAKTGWGAGAGAAGAARGGNERRPAAPAAPARRPARRARHSRRARRRLREEFSRLRRRERGFSRRHAAPTIEVEPFSLVRALPGTRMTSSSKRAFAPASTSASSSSPDSSSESEKLKPYLLQ